jgi:TBC1 domain family protein 5
VWREPTLNTAPQEETPNSVILRKLDRIQGMLLKKYDSEVFHRLKVLDIAPSIYGLRWIRILFAREFSIEQTLKLWDAIFADSVTLELVDYVFVSMLCHYRHLFIKKDAMDCMRLLMRLVNLALALSFVAFPTAGTP